MGSARFGIFPVWSSKRVLVEHLQPGKYNSLEKIAFNVGLDIPFARKCAAWMNERLPGGSGYSVAKTTVGEVVRFWGYLIAICQLPSEPVDTMWRKTSQPGDIFGPPMLGKHGMHKNRFMKLRSLQALMFHEDENDLDENDDWRYCRELINSFNNRRLQLVKPGWLLVADESMSAWNGDEGVLPGKASNPKPIPFLSYVERKPEPLGCEIKVLADAECSCTLRLEIQEGAARHEMQQWFDEYGHTTAVSLRLLKPFFKTAQNPHPPLRAYYADSWFTSVTEMEAVYWESGKTIYAFGDIKTNTSRFPKEELAQLVGPNSGDWATITTSVQLPDDSTLRVMGVGHRRGPEVHTFGSTCGRTLLGNPQRHKDDDLDDTGHFIARKCPMVLNDATKAQPKIDRTNKRRQFHLAIEKRFITESFPFRLFCTVLGTQVVDTFYLNEYFNRDKVDWRTAMRRISNAMMHNRLDDIDCGECTADELFKSDVVLFDTATTIGTAEETKSQLFSSHLLVPFKRFPGYCGAKQERCVVSGKLTTLACVTCSVSADVFLPIHAKHHADHKRNPDKYACIAVRKASKRKAPASSARVRRSKRNRSENASVSADEQDQVEDNEEFESESEEVEGEESDEHEED